MAALPVTLVDVLARRAGAQDVVVRDVHGIDVMPGGRELAGLMRTFVRMTAQGSPYTRLRHAVRGGNVLLVTATAAECPQLDLEDALAICVVLRGDPRYDRACVRWIGRFSLEAPGATLQDVGNLTDALEELAGLEPRGALEALARVCERRGIRHARKLLGEVPVR